MKGAYLLSTDVHLFERAAGVLVTNGGSYSTTEDTAQIRDEAGRLFTIYPSEGRDIREEPFTVAPGVTARPDMEKVSICLIECRWEDYFAEVVRQIALSVEGDTWVVDGNDVLWAAQEVDPDRIVL